FSSRTEYVPGGSCAIRYKPVSSVTPICSPCKLGDVAVTTASATGDLVAESITVPIKTPLPSANATPFNETSALRTPNNEKRNGRVRTDTPRVRIERNSRIVSKTSQHKQAVKR